MVKNFIVPVPKPYILEREITPDDVARLLAHAQVLWKVLDMLDISAQEAYEKGYTLNWDTHNELDWIALRGGHHEALAYLRKNTWEKAFRNEKFGQ